MKKEVNLSEIKLLILQGFQECRKDIKADIESAVHTAFSKIGLDLSNQEQVNDFHRKLLIVQDLGESKKETKSLLKSAFISVAVPACVSAFVIGIAEYMKRM